jgi:signal transduction histidine kinase/CheY-like chemotaxis protein
LLTRGTSSECLKQLSRGAVDAVILTRLTGLSQVHFLKIQNVESVGAHIERLKVAYCIATRLGDEELLAQVNEALATLSTTGRTVEIYTKWFGQYEPQQVSGQQILLIVAAAMAFAFAVMLFAWLHQRRLRKEISRQAVELRESQRILAEAQRVAHLGHFRRELGKDGRIQWSAESFRIFEMDDSLPAPGAQDGVHLADENDRERWRAAITSIERDQKEFDIDVLIHPKPGVSKTIHVRAHPVFDENGKHVANFGTFQDVTKMRAAESALRHSEGVLQALFANVPMGLGVVERTGNEWRVVSVNPAAIKSLSMNREKLVGQTLSGCGMEPEWVGVCSQLFKQCVDDNRLISSEHARRDLRKIFFSTVIPIETQHGKPRCCFLIDDVTIRKRQDAEISQGRRLRAIGELVGGIAHEFNNLLTPIRLGAESLRDEWKENKTLSEDLSIIAEAAVRSADLVERLLTFGRNKDQNIEQIDVAEIIESNFDLLGHTIDRRIKLSSRIPGDLPKLYLNRTDIHQIVINLLVNASDTINDKLEDAPEREWRPLIEVDAAELTPAEVDMSAATMDLNAESWVRLSVRDTGCGMTQEVLDRLFEPFYSTKETGRGTGLGLATVWHLVTGFGGRVSVESNLGVGSVFNVYLPVLDVPEGIFARPQIEKSEPTSIDGVKRLLVLDDEYAIGSMIETLFKRRGHFVEWCDHPDEAWKLLSASPDVFDAMLLDLNMPGMNGTEFARRARGIEFDGPIIVMSGLVSAAQKAELAELGVKSIVNKPFSFDVLEAALVRAFAEDSAN